MVFNSGSRTKRLIVSSQRGTGLYELAFCMKSWHNHWSDGHDVTYPICALYIRTQHYCPRPPSKSHYYDALTQYLLNLCPTWLYPLYLECGRTRYVHVASRWIDGPTDSPYNDTHGEFLARLWPLPADLIPPRLWKEAIRTCGMSGHRVHQLWVIDMRKLSNRPFSMHARPGPFGSSLHNTFII